MTKRADPKVELSTIVSALFIMNQLVSDVER